MSIPVSDMVETIKSQQQTKAGFEYGEAVTFFYRNYKVTDIFNYSGSWMVVLNGNDEFPVPVSHPALSKVINVE